MRRSAIAVICLSGLLAACASSGATGGATTTSQSASRTDASRITADEIAAANLPTAFDLVDRLRKPWLRRSGMGGEVVVYMEERQLGDAGKLRDIPAATVAELQYVANADAVRRWGGGIDGGVIVVVLRR